MSTHLWFHFMFAVKRAFSTISNDLKGVVAKIFSRTYRECTAKDIVLSCSKKISKCKGNLKESWKIVMEFLKKR